MFKTIRIFKMLSTYEHYLYIIIQGVYKRNSFKIKLVRILTLTVYSFVEKNLKCIIKAFYSQSGYKNYSC